MLRPSPRSGARRQERQHQLSQQKLEIRRLIQKRLAEIETDAIIDAFPSCPRWASRRVDLLTMVVQP